MAKLKSKKEIELMRQAGALVARILQAVEEAARPHVTTAALNALAEEMIAAAGAEPLFKGVKSSQAKLPYPAALCTSVNEQVVHGIPGPRVLAEGDVLSVDCGVRLKGYCGDAAVTLGIGQVGPEAEELIRVTQEALQIAVSEIKPNRSWSDVAGEIQRHVEQAGFSIVREFVGHGIGESLHEDPKVPNYVEPGRKMFALQAGLVLAVEPMVNVGSPGVCYADPIGWTVVTQDRSLSAHFEHTIAVTSRGGDVLTDGR